MDKQKFIIQSNNLIIPNSYTVEVPLVNFTRGSNNNFLLNQYLQKEGTDSVLYNGLEVFFNTQQSYTESNRPVITAANAAKVAINLKLNGKDKIYLAPYVSYNTLINYGMIRRFVPQKFDLTDSYIRVMEDLPDNTTSALLVFYFDPAAK